MYIRHFPKWIIFQWISKLEVAELWRFRNSFFIQVALYYCFTQRNNSKRLCVIEACEFIIIPLNKSLFAIYLKWILCFHSNTQRKPCDRRRICTTLIMAVLSSWFINIIYSNQRLYNILFDNKKTTILYVVYLRQNHCEEERYLPSDIANNCK